MGLVLQGCGVSPGVAVGRILLLESDSLPVLPTRIPADRVEPEVGRLHRARERARQELQELRDRAREALGGHYSAVLDAQMFILDDPELLSATEERIRRDGMSAGWALHGVVADFGRRLDRVDDGYFRERGGDLADVHRRLQRHLRGSSRGQPSRPEGPLVLVAHALGPSDAIAFAREGVVGFATDAGGPTSHTAILAQALSVPAVVGLHDVSRRARPGEPVILDGFGGRVHVSPSPAEMERALEQRDAWLARERATVPVVEEPAVTRDGIEIVLRANIEFPEQIDVAMRRGAHGVGLYRSEFLGLAGTSGTPSEEAHYRVYREILEKVSPYPAIVRTLDLGGEKITGSEPEPNPALGLRALRAYLAKPEIFVPQLRALLRAAVHGDVRVLLPLVVSREDIRKVRGLLAEQARLLGEEGQDCRTGIPVGAMVEVPAAAVSADLLAREADFLSIGTNDLIQYALAVDRGNESVARFYEPAHPGVLRLILCVAESAARNQVPVSVCGEMAADPRLAVVLVGLGLRELSIEPRNLVEVRRAIRAVHASRAEELAQELVDLPTASDVLRRLRTVLP